MKKTIASFMIAAPKSNSGKTLITLGLINTFKDLGNKVQTFKCGPDYIDPMHHKYNSGNASYNLDSWMSSKKHVKSLYQEHTSSCDICITEGVMGLFDGAYKDEGSSADIAKLLDIPIVLVVDAGSTAYSVAPLLYGFKNFDKNINLIGVIFNKVASKSHYQFLKDAAKDADVICFGYIPRDPELIIESRHLGLQLPGEQNSVSLVKRASKLIKEHINLELLLSKSSKEISETKIKKTDSYCKKKLKIALASDKAFSFTYQANIDLLKEIGEITYFSPLRDKELPDADLLWLPGGYPELFAKELSSNISMHKSIIKFINNNKTVIAECGGMMYLGEQMILKDGSTYNMVGAFNYRTSMEKMKLHLGYRKIEISSDINILAHEFHFSEITHTDKNILNTNVTTARNTKSPLTIYRKNNCWTSYAHLYLGEKEKMMEFLEWLNLKC